jgi:energy-coupling factor transporter ATP-binding protein EcfA2
VTIYNPHLLAQQDLIDTFVARRTLLDDLLDDLGRGGGQHHLLVGRRGSGKTTLLLRLAAAIEDDKQLAKKCIPLRFPEEQYNVSRPSDFWMNAIDALVDALEDQGDRLAANRLESSLAELDPLDEAGRSERSLALLEGWAKQAKRLIVLLVDNLDLVLDRLAKSLWELREALSIDNRLVVVGASSRFIEEAIDYQSPFYDFFRVHELGPLSEDEARQVIFSLAQRANTPKVAEVLEHDPGRFKALFALTGGMPRTLALLHTVLALEQRDSIERDLDGLLDQFTPYYKARFDDLPSQSQVIVDKVALHWDRSPPRSVRQRPTSMSTSFPPS